MAEEYHRHAAELASYEFFGKNIVPRFHPMACGTPGKSGIWSGTWKKVCKNFRPVDAQPDINRFKEFLNLRCCEGKLLGDFFVSPNSKGAIGGG